MSIKILDEKAVNQDQVDLRNAAMDIINEMPFDNIVLMVYDSKTGVTDGFRVGDHIILGGIIAEMQHVHQTMGMRGIKPVE